MSGWSETSNCPECGSKDSFESWGDRHEVGGFCYECGYSYKTVEEQMTLDEVNELRKEAKLEPLTCLQPRRGEC